MKIKLYRSATVGIISKDYKLLQDPWLTDGEYYGSWYHYPSFEFNNYLDEINSYNGIYISHIHPDHCSEDTLKKINKNIPVYIHSYHAKFLKNKIERLGFKVFELENNKKNKIGKNFSINIMAADNCDPELCYKFTGCAKLDTNNGSQQIDTLAILEDGNSTILNVNDCPYELAKISIPTILKSYDKIDILLTGYGGAGPYPQCFENLSLKEKLQESYKKKINFLNKALEYIKICKPKYYLPFAGRYILSGSLSNLNSLRGLPETDEAYDYLDGKIILNKLNTKSIKINPGSEFDLKLEQSNEEYRLFNKSNYLNFISSISNKKFFYQQQDDIAESQIFDLAESAFSRFREKINSLNIKIKSNIFLDFDSKKMIAIQPSLNKFDLIDREKIESSQNYVIYKLDKNLLYNILQGPRIAHWNNAEIGSHIKFFRNPNKFERNLYLGMCYYHN